MCTTFPHTYTKTNTLTHKHTLINHKKPLKRMESLTVASHSARKPVPEAATKFRVENVLKNLKGRFLPEFSVWVFRLPVCAVCTVWGLFCVYWMK